MTRFQGSVRLGVAFFFALHAASCGTNVYRGKLIRTVPRVDKSTPARYTTNLRMIELAPPHVQFAVSRVPEYGEYNHHYYERVETRSEGGFVLGGLLVGAAVVGGVSYAFASTGGAVIGGLLGGTAGMVVAEETARPHKRIGEQEVCGELINYRMGPEEPVGHAAVTIGLSHDDITISRVADSEGRVTIDLLTDLSLAERAAELESVMLVAKHEGVAQEFTLGRLGLAYLDGIKGPASGVREESADGQLGDYGKKYAIVIGVSDYEHLDPPPDSPADGPIITEGKLFDLRFADRDARAFAAHLANSAISGGDWEIHSFVDEDATFQRVDTALTEILELANRRDLIFVFFSGHARSHPRRPGDVYLLTHDFDPKVDRSGYPYSLLTELIATTKSEHVIAFIDACRSGTIGFFKGDRQPEAMVAPEEFGRRISQIRENRVVFTSASGTQPSWEDRELQHGVFTYYLVRGLEGWAPEHRFPAFVDLGELQTYVSQRVLRHTEENPEMAPQLPGLFESRGAPDENFPVAIRQKASS
jgi:hypothetical protein